MKCIECDSKHDENCFDTATAKRKDCPLELGCYHYYDGKDIRRGCMADLDEETRKSCESDSDECKKCFDHECNWKSSFQSCVFIKNQNSTENPSKICKKYTDECFTYVYDKIRKGCMSDITESIINDIDIKDCDNDDICVKCGGKANCNDKVIEHEICIVCLSKNDRKCIHYPELLKKDCPLRLNDMGCYLKKDDNIVERGCMSMLDSSMLSDCRAGDRDCKMCIGNECNKKLDFQICYNCDSELDGDNCIHEPWKLKHGLCPNYLDYCYTMVENGRVQRNCTGDKAIPNISNCTENNECKYCENRRSCNDEVFRTKTCIACNSNNDPMCANDTTFELFEECPISLHTHKCYHFIDETNKKHERGTNKYFTIFV